MRVRSNRARVSAFAAAVALTLIARSAPVSASDAGAEGQFLILANQDRSAAGLPALSLSGDLADIARQHAVEMADAGAIFHVDFASRVSGWLAIAENVGMSPSVAAMHQSFTTSAPHRANILDARYTEVGIGVEWRGSTLYVTEIFRQPRVPAAKPARTETPAATSPPATAPPNTFVPPTTIEVQAQSRSTWSPRSTTTVGVTSTTPRATSAEPEDQAAAPSVEKARSAGSRLDSGGDTAAREAVLLGLFACFLAWRRRAGERTPR